MRYGNIDSYGDVFFSDSDVAHGMTALMPTTVYGSLSPVSGTSGGFLFQGLSDADGAGIEFHGVSGAASPTIAGVQIRGGKKDGTTWQAVAANEKVLEVFNYNTSLLTLLGNGVLNIIGDSIQINSKTITVDGALNISGDSAINQDVRTTASPTFGAINIAAGGILQHNGNTVLDASRNLSNIGTINSYSIGNASGNIAVSNGTVNTNLNADMVDGIHLNVFSFSNAGSCDLSGSTTAFAGIRFTSPTFTDIYLNFFTFGSDMGILFRNSSGQQINCSGVIYYWT